MRLRTPAPTLTLRLVRHGRTRYNDEGLLQGWADSELTAAGLDGVAATAAHLADVPFVAAFASPSPRTVTTAKHVLRHHPGLGLATASGLREFGFGHLEARPEPELYSWLDPVVLFRQVFEGTFPGLPGGESGAAYMSRVARCFLEIEQAHRAGGEVLVVSHGVTLMAYLTMIGAVPQRPLTNASVTTVDIRRDGRRSVRSFGVDPSGRAVVPEPVQLQVAGVALEEAARWHGTAEDAQKVG